MTDELGDLEDALRDLPPPRPPAELQRRLLADIPRIERSRSRSLLASRTVVAWATITAAILTVILVQQFVADLPTARDSRPASTLNTHTPQVALDTDVPLGIQETRPCDILPPFPDLH